MSPRDIALALFVAIAWGFGFVLTRYAVAELSVTLITALRFAIAALPCAFLARPAISPLRLIGIGAMLVGQFLSQTYGMSHGVPPGLTAVIVQSQALFTIAFAAIVFKDIPTPAQTIGIAVATCGLGLIFFTVGYDFSITAFAITMAAPIFFALSNILLRGAHGASMLNLSAWSALATLPIALPVLFALDGPQPSWDALTHMSWFVIGCILILAIAGQTLSYWIWGGLLGRYSAAQVVPFALLVPFIGAAASAVLFGERFGTVRAAGALTVVVGIAVMLLGGRLRRPAALS